MRIRLPFLAALGLAVLCGLNGPRRADVPELGGQLTVSQLESNLGGSAKWFTGKPGVGGGLHCLFDLGGGHALRPRGDVAFFRDGPIKLMSADDKVQLYQETAKIRLLSLGMDYNYFPAANNTEGFYILLGLAGSSLHCTGAAWAPGAGTPGSAWPASQSASALSYSAGAGWRLTPHLGTELRYSQSMFKNLGISGTAVKSPVLNLSLTMDL